MKDSRFAMVFPGQGSQRTGMARDFHDNYAVARDAFAEASEATGIDLAALCFEPDDRLTLTEYVQPALLTASVAAVRVLEAEFGVRGAVFGGHSLGEYTALVAAGVLRLGAAAAAVRERGRLMQEAVPVGEGRMVAVIAKGLDLAAVETATEGLRAVIANDNSPDQVVVSGAAEDTRTLEARLGERLGAKGFRAIELKVSAPFHSPLMAPIEAPFAEVLAALPLANLERAAAVTSNYTGGFHEPDAEAVRERLRRQISGRVRWRENMTALQGASERILEVGPTATLRGFFKAIDCAIDAVTDLESAKSLAF